MLRWIRKLNRPADALSGAAGMAPPPPRRPPGTLFFREDPL